MSEKSQELAYYAVIPAQVLRNPHLREKTKLVYGLVASLAREDGYCWASNERLAELMSCGERSITRAISELMDAGELVVRMTGSRDRKGNRERRLYTRETAVRSLAQNGETASLGETGVAQIGETVNNVDNIVSITPHTPQRRKADATPEMFDRFWALYPKKRDKMAALRAWRRLNPTAALCMRMSRALKAQIKSDEWQRDGGRYVPYPATWLNGRRWEDEPDVPPSDGGQKEAFGVWR